jgi:Alg9-like mannosyltransferase family
MTVFNIYKLAALCSLQHGRSSDGKPAAPTTAAATRQHTNESLALLIAAVCVAVRPTSATLWAAVGLARLYRLPRAAWLRYVLRSVLPIVGSVLTVSTVVDRWLYGQWVFVPYQFLKFNVLDGKSALFGVQVSLHVCAVFYQSCIPAVCKHLTTNDLQYAAACY